MISKAEIDRIGEKVRVEFPSISESTLNNLQDYRTSHKESLSDVFNELCLLSKSVSKSSITTYRIKRFESIISKLLRQPKMRLNRMGDIGGCRCILENDKEVNRLRLKIEKKFKVVAKSDYIEKPKANGYRSLHLIVEVFNSDKRIEIQLRNKEDHNWATLVEITDLLYDSRLKELDDNKELSEFHYLLSRKTQLAPEEIQKTVDLISKYDYFERLSKVFSRNYVEVRKRWIELGNKNGHKFFLIEASKNEVPRIESFRSFNEAEKMYFELYKKNTNANIVLTYLPTPNYKQVSIAYSNYILTYHSFIDDCYRLFESIVISKLKDCNYNEFFKYFVSYHKLVVNHIINIYSEIYEVNKIAINSGKYKISHLNLKEREWVDDINRTAKKRIEYAQTIHQKMVDNKPKSYFSQFSFNLIIWFISKKYQRQLNTVLKKIGFNPNT
jgi:ppGpp synthetase/RelA/SpoT-type nucleotidyltranferase